MRKNLDRLSVIILIISGVVVLFSFIAPVVFIHNSFFRNTFVNTGQIGDTIGGIMNPYVALSGVFLTFLAFYIQFQSNMLQRELFRKELDSNRFENQFYEMLKLHKENVEEIHIDLFKYTHTNKPNPDVITHPRKDTIRGRKVFNYLIREFEVLFYTAKNSMPDAETKVLASQAYSVFFLGIDKFEMNTNAFYRNVHRIKQEHKETRYQDLGYVLEGIVNHSIKSTERMSYDLFEGQAYQLAHYYRTLFQLVKFVINQDSETHNYKDKRKYLRILRAQLSTQEQAMLFYSWVAGYGHQWQNENNRFFTDYRMIHNIHQSILIDEIKITDYFALDSGYLVEEGRKTDSLFEFQDWNPLEYTSRV